MCRARRDAADEGREDDGGEGGARDGCGLAHHDLSVELEHVVSDIRTRVCKLRAREHGEHGLCAQTVDGHLPPAESLRERVAKLGRDQFPCGSRCFFFNFFLPVGCRSSSSSSEGREEDEGLCRGPGRAAPVEDEAREAQGGVGDPGTSRAAEPRGGAVRARAAAAEGADVREAEAVHRDGVVEGRGLAEERAGPHGGARVEAEERERRGDDERVEAALRARGVEEREGRADVERDAAPREVQLCEVHVRDAVPLCRSPPQQCHAFFQCPWCCTSVVVVDGGGHEERAEVGLGADVAP